MGPPARSRGFPYGWLVFAVALALYARTAAHPFVEYDDPEYVRDNPHLADGLSPATLRWAFTSTEYQYNWHPLTWLSHALDVQLFSMDAGRHHLVNALLHATNAALLFAALRGLTGRAGPSAWVALLFAVHPLRVESVAWIAERKDLLAGAFFFLALLAHARRARAPSFTAHALVFLAMAAGLMAKPTLITLPLLLLVLDIWPLGRLATSTPRALVLEKIPLLALSLGSVLLTLAAQHAGGAVDQTLSWSERLMHAPVAYVAYLRQYFWPAGLAVFYPHPGLVAPGESERVSALLASALLLGLGAAAWKLRRRFPAVPVGLLWFVGLLVPMIGLVQVGWQSHADRYLYLAGIGIELALVFGVAALLEQRPSWRPAGVALGVGVAVACSAVSWRQIGFWRSSSALFEHALAVTDRNFVAHNLLGNELGNEGRLDEALAHFVEAAEIRPGFFQAELNAGKVLFREKELDGARAAIERALQARPGSADAHFELGLVLAQGGDYPAADAELRRALELEPAIAQLPAFREARARLDRLLSGR